MGYIPFLESAVDFWSGMFVIPFHLVCLQLQLGVLSAALVSSKSHCSLHPISVPSGDPSLCQEAIKEPLSKLLAVWFPLGVKVRLTGWCSSMSTSWPLKPRRIRCICKMFYFKDTLLFKCWPVDMCSSVQMSHTDSLLTEVPRYSWPLFTFHATAQDQTAPSAIRIIKFRLLTQSWPLNGAI